MAKGWLRPLPALAVLALLTACPGTFVAPSRLALVAPQPFSAAVVDAFPDGRPTDPVSAAVFDQINRDRASAGLAPVRWDEKASSLAADYTREQIREGTFGHFLLDGVPPYARLSRRGDLGMGTENSSAYVFFGDYVEVPALKLALDSHRGMLEETPPNDGHRRAILDPAATHVGVGWSQSGPNFRLAEEFTARQFDWLKVDRFGPDGSAISVKGRALPGMRIAFVSVARQDLPSELSRDAVNSRHSYSYPSPRYALVPAGSDLRAGGLINLRCVTPSVRGRFSFDYLIDQPGLWTFVLYFDRKGESQALPGASFTVWVDEEKGPSVRS
jgi:uncharacterized protein YkwD